MQQRNSTAEGNFKKCWKQNFRNLCKGLLCTNYFENGYWKLLAEILVEINKNILDLVFIIFCFNRNE